MTGYWERDSSARKLACSSTETDGIVGHIAIHQFLPVTTTRRAMKWFLVAAISFSTAAAAMADQKTRSGYSLECLEKNDLAYEFRGTSITIAVDRNSLLGFMSASNKSYAVWGDCPKTSEPTKSVILGLRDEATNFLKYKDGFLPGISVAVLSAAFPGLADKRRLERFESLRTRSASVRTIGNFTRTGYAHNMGNFMSNGDWLTPEGYPVVIECSVGISTLLQNSCTIAYNIRSELRLGYRYIVPPELADLFFFRSRAEEVKVLETFERWREMDLLIQKGVSSLISD